MVAIPGKMCSSNSSSSTNSCIPGGMSPCMCMRMESALVQDILALSVSIRKMKGRKSDATARNVIGPHFAYDRYYMKACALTAEAVKYADFGERKR